MSYCISVYSDNGKVVQELRVNEKLIVKKKGKKMIQLVCWMRYRVTDIYIVKRED